MQNSQKPLTEKEATHVQRRNLLGKKKRSLFSFSSDLQIDNTEIFLATGGRRHAPVSRRRVSTSSSCLFNQPPTTKNTK